MSRRQIENLLIQVWAGWPELLMASVFFIMYLES